MIQKHYYYFLYHKAHKLRSAQKETIPFTYSENLEDTYTPTLVNKPWKNDIELKYACNFVM